MHGGSVFVASLFLALIFVLSACGNPNPQSQSTSYSQPSLAYACTYNFTATHSDTDPGPLCHFYPLHKAAYLHRDYTYARRGYVLHSHLSICARYL